MKKLCVLVFGVVALAGCPASTAEDSADPEREQERGEDAGSEEGKPEPSKPDESSKPEPPNPDEPSEPKDEGVPMFVAVGWGGRRVMSCDLGRTWIADQQIAPEADDNWHRSYTPKGLTFGGGKFIFLTGWGTDSMAHVSTNGIDWTSQQLDTAYGGIGYDQGRFVLVGNRHLSASEDGAATWKVLSDVPTPTADRETAAFDKVWAAGADGSAAFRLAGSDKWVSMPNCTGSRHTSIGITGGFAAGLGVLVSVGDQGNTCAVDLASGAGRGAGTIGTKISGRVAFLGNAFWLANGNAIYTSTNGVAWSQRALPQGVRFDLVARSNSGTYVGVSADGDRFYYSDDGENWKAGSGPSGNGLLRVVFGYGAPSSKCPAP
jgi:hypothetical protein